ncbi:MAG: T9SS type A sorting domain-containing protein, partial [Candidatus Lokiarchaeota archaeon]|nr:T9SS type A sorting domain-containing protein [Candidatus Lokiarchaeota archaeon]
PFPIFVGPNEGVKLFVSIIDWNSINSPSETASIYILSNDPDTDITLVKITAHPNSFTAIKPDQPEYLKPENIILNKNYPNPFNPTTTFSYELPKAAFVTLSIFNTSGQLIETLINRAVEAGHHHVKWDAGDLSSGIYLYQLKAGDQLRSGKCLLVK